MKRIGFFLILATLLQVPPVHAQRFGDGRFLRRLMGLDESQQTLERERIEALQKARLQQEEAAKKQRAAAQGAQRSVPTPAIQPRPSRSNARTPYSGSRTPTPATRQSAPTPYGYRPFSSPNPSPRPSAVLEPTPAKRLDPRSTSSSQLGAPNPAERPDYQRTRFPRPRLPSTTPIDAVSTADDKDIKNEKPKGSGTIDGFGLSLDMKGDKVVVSRVKKGSTADDAGLKPGDRIESIGSLPIERINDAEQFADVLKPGDQLEFEFKRRGKEHKILVPYMRTATELSATELADQKSADSHENEKPAQMMFAPYAAKPKTAYSPAVSAAMSNRTSSFATAAPNNGLLPAKTTPSTDGRSRPNSSRTDSPNEVDQLHDIVKTQKQVIAELQKRIEQLETSSRSRPPINPTINPPN